MSRRLTTVVVVVAAVLALAAPAGADPAGPTDFQNEILRVEPMPDGVEFSIVGGDAFLRAEVEPGVELTVMGYFGEPYLRVLADGTVEENALSPSVVLNEDRYGTSVDYDREDASLPPEWRVVGSEGSWAWHDHRIHWMAESPPPGRSPGDLVFGEVTVPVVVDGTATTLYVSLEWLERPFPLAAVAGLALGLGAALLRHRVDVVLAVVALLTFTIGLRQWLFLPSETDPSFLQWAVPAVALAFVVLGMLRPLVANTAHLVAAAELIAWGVWRWESMIRAVLPTAQPWAFDRLVTALALSVGATAVTLLVSERLRPNPTSAT
jgi:hypothetical protein